MNNQLQASKGTLNSAIGLKIGLRRRQRDISAAELARRANLSKATLSAIEAGNGNPTLETLDAIAIALRIPLSDLLTVEASVEPTLRQLEKPSSKEISQQLLGRFGVGSAVELWHLAMPARSEFEGVPHAPGTLEHLLVNSGSLFAGPATDQRKLTAGDVFTFLADGAHRYRTTNSRADVTVVMVSPISSASQAVTQGVR